jgi:peptidoglycan/xylan/chitin deacetylase (PgdA/CDA1 family)
VGPAWRRDLLTPPRIFPGCHDSKIVRIFHDLARYVRVRNVTLVLDRPSISGWGLMGARLGHVVRAVVAAAGGFTLLAGCVFGAPTPTAASGAWQLVSQDAAPAESAAFDTGRPGPEHPAQPVHGPDCRVERCVALTFDDGPSVQTARLVELLERAAVPATFFVLGHQVTEHPAAARAAAGHAELGSHGWNHTSLTKMTGSQIGAELVRTNRVIAETVGRRPVAFRPPYGAVDAAAADELRRAGLPIALWSVDPEDWKVRDADVVHRRVTDAVRPGSVVLLHDLYASTVDAVPRIVADLRAQGYVFVTVSQMWDGQLIAGETYTGREAEWGGEQ